MSKKRGRNVSPHSHERRRLIKLAAAGAGALSFPALINACGEDNLIVNFQGGEAGDIFEKTVIAPFEKKFGVRVVHDKVGLASQDYAKIRASKGDPGFDVAAGLTAPEVILGAKEGLLEKITEQNVPNVKYIWENARTSMPPYGIVQNLQFAALYYNAGRMAAPKSWRDYWQPWTAYGDELRGRILQVKPGNILCHLVLILAARLEGGGIENMDPAFALLEAQKPYIGLSEQSSSKMAPYFENEEIWLSPYWSARASLYMERGIPMKMVMPQEGSLLLPNTAAVPVGARHKRLAFEFVNFLLEPEIQRDYCLAYHISPGRGDLGDWPEEFAAQQITTPAQMNAMQFPDYDKIAAQRNDWSLRWQKIMAA